jgi:trimeric autotransporter adhesin
MKQVHGVVSAMLLLCALFSQIQPGYAQQTISTNTDVVVPPLVNFSGVLTDLNGKPVTTTGVVGVTFSLYSEQNGGSPLWLETQNVQPDRTGHYTVMLGSTSSTGLPADIFVAGRAHWLGVQAQGQEEQPRVLLVSAPYALKAGDAQTLGGLPASAFVLAAPHAGGTSRAATEAASATTEKSISPAASSKVTSDVTTSGGAANTIAMYTTATNIQDSLLTQTGKTTINVGGQLNLPTTGTATATAGRNSQPQDFTASAYNSSTAAAVPQKFQWQAEPSGNDTATASGTLNLLYGPGTAKPAETGLQIASNGQITFAAGQTFSGTSAAIGVVGTTTGTLPFNSGVEGVASATSGSAAGVHGSSASPNGYGVEGASGNVGVYGTGGTISSVTGIGVEGSGNQYGVYGNVAIGTAANQAGVFGTTSVTSATTYGVEGTATATSGTEAGVFGNSSSTAGYGVVGTSPNVGLFGGGTGSGGIGVDGHGNAIGVKGVATASGGLSGYFGGGPVEVAGNGNNAFFGDPGCGSGFSGFGLTTDSLSGCSNYTMIGKSSGDVYLNSTGSASIHFRNGNSGNNSNGDLATIDNSGNLTVAGTVHGGNVATMVSANNQAAASTNDCVNALSAPNSNCLTPGMSVTVTTAGGPVLILAHIGGVEGAACVTANFYLVMDNQFISLDNLAVDNSLYIFYVSAQLQSLQVPAAGSHTFQVQEWDDASGCGSGDYVQTYVGYPASGDEDSPKPTRSIIVHEL